MRNKPGLVVWFTGLPGSGKSTIAVLVANSARKSNHSVVLLSMDEIRRIIFPKPTYSDEERDASYRALVFAACLVSKTGANVLIDATGHKIVWRNLARKACSRFVEIYVKCPIDICIERETKRKNNNHVRRKLYLAALRRLRTRKKTNGLGKVPGVDEPFEAPRNPEIVLNSAIEKPRNLAKIAAKKLAKYAPELFS